MTPAELSQAVREAFAYAARYIGLLAENNPHGSAAATLARPDVHAVLQDAFDTGRELAQDAVREAWGGAPQAAYLSWLLQDIGQAYSSVAILRADIREAWDSVHVQPFVPGVTPPGTNPAMDAARERAELIRQAVLGFGSGLALRNRLSAEVASVAAQTESVLAGAAGLEQAGEQPYKRWMCRNDPPDALTCHWCRFLHGMTIPLTASFPAGAPADLSGHGHLTQPPRLYHGVLPGPPRHPRCRCRIIIVTLPEPVSSPGSGSREAPPGGVASPGAGGAAPSDAPPGFLAAADIRSLPEERYQALVHFQRAAAHELGQSLARLRRLG